jgi:hypothetical protein
MITVRPSSVARGDVICDFCVLRDQGCLLERQAERCGHFVPALSFVSDAGLDGAFSTFRGSSVWFDRAQIIHRTHRTVGLATTTGEHIGYAKVHAAMRSGFDQLMREHAWSNHLCKGQGFTTAEAAVWLTRWIRDHMGSRFVNRPHALGTVIYLERTDGPE